MRLRLAASASAVALGLIGIAIAAARIGRFLLVAQGEEVLVPVSAALIGLGLGGIALTLAAGRRRLLLAALAIGVVGTAVGLGARMVSSAVSADPPGGVFVAYRQGETAFAWPLTWSLVAEPALAALSVTLVLLAVVAALAQLARLLRGQLRT